VAAEHEQAGKRVVFVSGDNADAKQTVKELIAAMGFAPST
jgi:predicted dinucleotide-binding enzyme